MLHLTSFFESFLQDSRRLFFIYHLQEKRVVYVNRTYEALLQGQCERVNQELVQLLGRVHPDDRDHMVDCWQRWTDNRLRDAFELRLQHPDQPDQWWCISPHYFVGPEGEVWLGGLAEDISVAKATLFHADKFNSKKNATLEILSHDLAGPFALLQQMSTYFSHTVEPLQDLRLNRMIDEMGDLCRDSISLIHDFVDNEFMESANVVLKRERVDLVEKLRLVLEEYKNSERHLAKHFVFQTDAEVVYINMDQNKFQQVINNLISNALKFTPDGSTIAVSVRRTAQCALVEVADNGVGIPAVLQPGLFEKFTKSRRPGLRGERTTGLGMSIIKNIVELHDGTIWFESAEDKGTTFYLEIPLADQLA